MKILVLQNILILYCLYILLLYCMDGSNLCDRVYRKHYLDLAKIHPHVKRSFSAYFVKSVYLLNRPNANRYARWKLVRTSSASRRNSVFSIKVWDYAGCVLILSDVRRRLCIFVKISDIVQPTTPTTTHSTLTTSKTTSPSVSSLVWRHYM
jgi:hypothetical protein